MQVLQRLRGGPFASARGGRGPASERHFPAGGTLQHFSEACCVPPTAFGPENATVDRTAPPPKKLTILVGEDYY